MKRDNNIELFRTLLMLGICVLHAITMCGHPNQVFSGPLSACVDGFAFISGYYGVRFKLSKILKLYALGLYCIIVGVSVSYATFGPADFSMGWMEYVARAFKYHWFLHAYVVMMMLAPIVNYAIETSLQEKNHSRLMAAIVPIFLLVFGWGGLRALPMIGRFFPVSSGVTAYSGLTLFGVYVAARIFRCYNLDRKITPRCLIVAFPILCVLSGPCRFYEYSTPVALLLACLAFTAFKRIHVSLNLAWLTPSLFPVYFYHTFNYGNKWVEASLDLCLQAGSPLVISYFLAGLMVFTGCIILDLPRRMMLMPLKPSIDRLCGKIDSWYEGLLVCFAH